MALTNGSNYTFLGKSLSATTNSNMCVTEDMFYPLITGWTVNINVKVSGDVYITGVNNYHSSLSNYNYTYMVPSGLTSTAATKTYVGNASASSYNSYDLFVLSGATANQQLINRSELYKSDSSRPLRMQYETSDSGRFKIGTIPTASTTCLNFTVKKTGTTLTTSDKTDLWLKIRTQITNSSVITSTQPSLSLNTNSTAYARPTVVLPSKITLYYSPVQPFTNYTHNFDYGNVNILSDTFSVSSSGHLTRTISIAFPSGIKFPCTS